MSTPLDIHILPIEPPGGNKSASPALLTAYPPRRASRVRRNDRILIAIHFQGTAKFPENQQHQMLEKLAEGYFKSRGTVTSSMRDMAVSVNDLLWNRNKRSSAHGQTVTAAISLMVFREKYIYIMQSSPASVQHFAQGHTEEYRERNLSMHGLGSTQVPKLQFFQAQLDPGDMLIYSLNKPDIWSEQDMGSLFGKPIRKAYQLLAQGLTTDPGGMLINVRTGLGEINLIQERPVVAPLKQAAEARPPETSRPGYVPPFVMDDMPGLEKEPDDVPVFAAEEAVEQAEESEAPIAEPADEPEEAPVVSAAPIKEPPVIAPTEMPGPAFSEIAMEKANEIFRAVLTRLRDGIRFLGKSSERIGDFFRNLLPGDGLLQIPSSYMAGAAIVIPIVVVAVALYFYFNIGYNRQYQFNMTEALKAAELAEQAEDYEEIRYQWEYARSFANKAEEYKVTEDSKGLQVYITSNLDILDGISRQIFRPIIVEDLGEDVHIDKLITSGKDVYALDKAQGKVTRIFKTATGYEKDPDFQCSSDSLEVGQLIDIAPVGFIDESYPVIMGFDSSYNLVLCFQSGAPNVINLVPAPGTGFQGPTTIATDQNKLYILDPAWNSIRLYTANSRDPEGEKDTLFPDESVYYFDGNENKPSVVDVVDLTTDLNLLYLLRNDNSVFSCYFSGFSGVSPVVCEDNPLIDTRPGKVDKPFISAAQYGMIQRTAAPEQSIFLADMSTGAIHQFTLQMSFVRQVLPYEPLSENPLSAFTVSSERRLFTAYGDSIYYADLP